MPGFSARQLNFTVFLISFIGEKKQMLVRRILSELHTDLHTACVKDQLGKHAALSFIISSG